MSVTFSAFWLRYCQQSSCCGRESLLCYFLLLLSVFEVCDCGIVWSYSLFVLDPPFVMYEVLLSVLSSCRGSDNWLLYCNCVPLVTWLFVFRISYERYHGIVFRIKLFQQNSVVSILCLANALLHFHVLTQIQSPQIHGYLGIFQQNDLILYLTSQRPKQIYVWFPSNTKNKG